MRITSFIVVLAWAMAAGAFGQANDARVFGIPIYKGRPARYLTVAGDCVATYDKDGNIIRQKCAIKPPVTFEGGELYWFGLQPHGCYLSPAFQLLGPCLPIPKELQ